MVFNQMTLQAYSGLGLFAFMCWMLGTGMRWIRVPKLFVVHRISGILLFCVAVPHMLNGLDLAFGLFSRFVR